jgi:hypothetical protein
LIARRMAGRKAGGGADGAIIFVRLGHTGKGQTKKNPRSSGDKIGGVEWGFIYINEPTISPRY